jgi:hypothetical protein
MPLDQGAPAPSSRHAERLARLKLLRRKANSEQRKQRRFSKERLRTAESLLADVIDGADLIGEGPINNRSWYSPSGVYLLVALTWPSFDRLCAVGAEIEDLEDSNDHEPTDADHGEVDEYPQPSLLPATGADLLGWNSLAEDLEADGELVGSGCTDGQAQAVEEARSRYAAAAGSEVIASPARDPDGKPGAWLLLARGGAK